MSQPEKTAYARGMINGMSLSPLFGAPQDLVDPLGECVTGMSDYQIVAILEKHLHDNPEVWHETAPAWLFNAMQTACSKNGYKIGLRGRPASSPKDSPR